MLCPNKTALDNMYHILCCTHSSNLKKHKHTHMRLLPQHEVINGQHVQAHYYKTAVI